MAGGDPNANYDRRTRIERKEPIGVSVDIAVR